MARSKTSKMTLHIGNLSIDVRWMIYDRLLLEPRTIPILPNAPNQQPVPSPLQSLAGASQLLRDDVKAYFQINQRIKSCPVYGQFEPENSVFALDLRSSTYRLNAERSQITNAAISAFRKFASYPEIQQHVQHISFDIRVPVGENIPAMPLNLIEDMSFLDTLAEFEALRSVEIIMSDEILAHWTAMERKLEKDGNYQPGEMEGYMEFMVWRVFWFALSGTCGPGEACDCCVLPELRIRVLGTGVGEDVVVTLPTFAYLTFEQGEVEWYEIAGGMSEQKRIAGAKTLMFNSRSIEW